MALNELGIRTGIITVLKGIPFTTTMLFLDDDAVDVGELIEPGQGKVCAITIGGGDENGNFPGRVDLLGGSGVSEYHVHYTHTIGLWLDSKQFKRAEAVKRGFQVVAALLPQRTLAGAAWGRWQPPQFVDLLPTQWGRHAVWLGLVTVGFTQWESTANQ